MSEEDVERFLWDLERELAHLDGDQRRELVQRAEQRLHEAATRIAEDDGADRVQWYHYVQASAQLGPPERLAAELTGQPLPETRRSNRWLVVAAAALALVIAAMLGYAYVTTGDLHPLGTWEGAPEGRTGQETITFNVSGEADSVFVSLQIVPNARDALARVTVLDGSNRLVYENQATVEDHLETATFLQGDPGTWRVFIDFEGFTGSWRVSADEEID